MRGLPEFKLGLVPEVFQQYSGIRPIMLAIDGNSPIPVLDHLARDPGFDSRLIVSTIPMFLGEPLGDERSLKWVRDFSEQKWSSRIETHLAVFVEQNIAFRSSSLAPEELLEDLQKKRMSISDLRPHASGSLSSGLFVHYEDYPALQGYRLPDESHLSFDEAVRFTRNLTRILIRKGFDTDGCRGKETKR